MTTREFMAGKLREFRKASGMSVGDVGRAVGKSDKTISAWEVGRGQPDADMLVALCQLFTVDVSDFYYEDHEDKEDITLTDDEERLLTAYRSLDESQKNNVLGVVEALAK